MHQYQFSLVFFTVLTQWAIGCVLALSLYRSISAESSRKYSLRIALVIWAICSLGSVLSLAHLGDPLVAYNAIRGLASSWLSREVVAFSVINGFMTLWMLTHLVKGKENLQQPLGILTGLLGLCAIIMSGQIYYVIEHQPTWHTSLTHISFVSTALLLGLTSLITIMRFSGENIPSLYRYLLGASVLLIFAIIVNASQIAVRETISSLIWFRVGASVLGGCLLFMMADNIMKRSTWSVLAVGLLIVAGEIAGRMMFYSSALGHSPW